MAGIFSDSPTIRPGKIGGSAPQNTSVGSGSRPTSSRHKIETSAPTDPHTLGRSVPGALGSGKRAEDVR